MRVFSVVLVSRLIIVELLFGLMVRIRVYIVIVVVNGWVIVVRRGNIGVWVILVRIDVLISSSVMLIVRVSVVSVSVWCLIVFVVVSVLVIVSVLLVESSVVLWVRLLVCSVEIISVCIV